ncbi:MAG: hypothetical protein ABIV50_16385 [Opitutus sp.]
MRAPNPTNEKARIQAHQAPRILDTDREQKFDDPVQLAAQISACPMAVVSLVDAERAFGMSSALL